MKLSSNAESKSKFKKKIVIFVCVEIAGRNQTTEVCVRKYAPEDYEPMSAGTIPKSHVNPVVAEAMRENSINISSQKPNEINEEMIQNADKIVNKEDAWKRVSALHYLSPRFWIGD